MSPKSQIRHQVAWTVADVDVDDVRRSLELGEEHPGVIPGAGYEVAATGAMFWLSESGRIHQAWITTLTCIDPGKPHSALVAEEDLGGDSLVAGGVVLENAARGWGCGLPWKVPWQRSTGEDCG